MFDTFGSPLHLCGLQKWSGGVFFVNMSSVVVCWGLMCTFLCHCQASTALWHRLANCPASYRLYAVESGSQPSVLSLSVRIVGCQCMSRFGGDWQVWKCADFLSLSSIVTLLRNLNIHFRHVLIFLTLWAVLYCCVDCRSELVVFFCQHVLRLLFAGV